MRRRNNYVQRYAPVLLIFICTFWSLRTASADEQVRQVQEELRKRNLYYGDIDGRGNPELAEAISRYQQRKGFAITGTIDDPTLRSLGISAPAPLIAGDTLPDLPVLKSDMAPRSKEFRLVNLKPDGAASPTPPPQPAPPPVRDQVADFIRRYFAACETANVTDELDFYADQIDYYDRGIVDKAYIQYDLATYDERWPNRKYAVGKSIRISARGDDIVARCRVTFGLATVSAARHASGRTDHTFVLARRGESDWQIVSIKEVRVRPPVKPRGKPKKSDNVLSRAGNTLKKLFRTKDIKGRRWQDQRP
jgi:peptidoglycan hydrolase-like protein with peptidoglycan-binding domain